ncbi:MAG: hypothetical protein MRY83_15305 [Flavobacteriales bacterium]|nr:hypothetical protein [Flavobacteriales bacterium]
MIQKLSVNLDEFLVACKYDIQIFNTFEFVLGNRNERRNDLRLMKRMRPFYFIEKEVN